MSQFYVEKLKFNRDYQSVYPDGSIAPELKRWSKGGFGVFLNGYLVYNDNGHLATWNIFDRKSSAQLTADYYNEKEAEKSMTLKTALLMGVVKGDDGLIEHEGVQALYDRINKLDDMAIEANEEYWAGRDAEESGDTDTRKKHWKNVTKIFNDARREFLRAEKDKRLEGLVVDGRSVLSMIAQAYRDWDSHGNRAPNDMEMRQQQVYSAKASLDDILYEIDKSKMYVMPY